MTPEQNKLNMGCGFKKLDEFWNVDIEKKCNPDQVVDLEQFPWPFEDNFFEKIHADNILEHLGQDPKVFTKVIQEMYRVSKDKAEWFICFPHHRCDLFWDDYTHVRALSSKTFKMFDQKINFESIAKKLSDSTYGLYHGVDLEVYDENYRIIERWNALVRDGELGYKQLNDNMNTMANVAETVSVFCKVHKPGRFEEWFQSQQR